MDAYNVSQSSLPGTYRHFLRSALTLKALITAAAGDILIFLYNNYHFSENHDYSFTEDKNFIFHVNRLLDDSHEMSSFIFSER